MTLKKTLWWWIGLNTLVSGVFQCYNIYQDSTHIQGSLLSYIWVGIAIVAGVLSLFRKTRIAHTALVLILNTVYWTYLSYVYLVVYSSGSHAPITAMFGVFNVMLIWIMSYHTDINPKLDLRG